MAATGRGAHRLLSHVQMTPFEDNRCNPGNLKGGGCRATRWGGRNRAGAVDRRRVLLGDTSPAAEWLPLVLLAASELHEARDRGPAVAFQSEGGQLLCYQLLVRGEVLAFLLDFHAHYVVALPTQEIGPTPLRNRPASSQSPRREFLLGFVRVDPLEVDGCASIVPFGCGPAFGHRRGRECILGSVGLDSLGVDGWACTIFDGDHGQLLSEAVNGVLAVPVESLLLLQLQLGHTLLEPS